MDIPALSSAMAASNVAMSVNISMLKMQMGNMEEVGGQLSEMLAETGSMIDIKI